MMATFSRRSQRGLATVEFAIALPLLLFIMLATAEFGRLLSQYNTLNKSVRDAARYLASNALGGTTGVVTITSQVQTATTNLVLTGNAGGNGPVLLPGLAAGNVTVSSLANGYISVSTAYSYVPMLGNTLQTFGVTTPINMRLTLNATVVMRPL